MEIEIERINPTAFIASDDINHMVSKISINTASTKLVTFQVCFVKLEHWKGPLL